MLTNEIKKVEIKFFIKILVITAITRYCYIVINLKIVLYFQIRVKLKDSFVLLRNRRVVAKR